MPTIDLFFAGLIAFVAGDSYWTAYILEDKGAGCDHEATLTVRGSVHEGGANDFCKIVEGKSAFCNLNSVKDIYLATLKGNLRFEDHSLDELPENFTEGASEKWIVKMEKVHEPAKKIKGKDDLGELVKTSFEFKWQDVRSCSLEEGELGRVQSYFFKDREVESESQALAESILFTAIVDGAEATLTLAGGEKMTKLRLDCTGTCPLVLIENEASKHCMGGHFGHYYELAEGEPFPREPVPEPRPGKSKEEKKVSDKCKDQLKDSLKTNLKQNETGMGFLARKKLAFEALKVVPKVQDRIVCPPVVFE